MVFRKEKVYSVTRQIVYCGQLIKEQALKHNLLFDPRRNCRQKRGKASRCKRIVGFKQALELEKGLVIKNNSFYF